MTLEMISLSEVSQRKTSILRQHLYGESKKVICTSLVLQRLRIHLPVQGAWTPSLVQEESTLLRATKPVYHNYWASALQPVLHNKRSHYNEKPRTAMKTWSEVIQSYPTVCNPMDWSLPGSIHEIFQARILEWVAISFSREGKKR